MRKIAFLLLFAAALSSRAQVAISASSITDSFEHPLPAAKLCFTPVDATKTPAGFRVGSTQVVPNEVCGVVTNGVLQSGLTLAPVSGGVYYHFYVKTAFSNIIVRDFGLAQITGSSWSLDSFDPTLSVLPVSTITMGTVTFLAPGTGGSCSLTGAGSPYVLNCNIPMTATLTPRGAYASGTTYAVGDLVTYGGTTFASITGSNTGNQPDTHTANWLAVPLGGYPGVTTDGLGGLNVAGQISTGDGSKAGYAAYTQGPLPSLPSNSVLHAAPTAVPVSYADVDPAAPPIGPGPWCRSTPSGGGQSQWVPCLPPTATSATLTMQTPTTGSTSAAQAFFDATPVTTSGPLAQISVRFSVAPTVGQTINAVVANAPSGGNITVVAVIPLTIHSASTGVQTWNAPADFNTVGISAGQILGLWTATGNQTPDYENIDNGYDWSTSSAPAGTNSYSSVSGVSPAIGALVFTGSGSSAGGCMAAQTATGTGSAATITWTVPGTCTNLRIVANIRCAGGTAQDAMYMFFNGDANFSNYWGQYWYASGTSSGSGNLNGTSTKVQIGEAVCSSGPANSAGTYVVDIPNYLGSTTKGAVSTGQTLTNSGMSPGPTLANQSMYWTGTAPITTITIGTQSGSNITNQSTATLSGN